MRLIQYIIVPQKLMHKVYNGFIVLEQLLVLWITAQAKQLDLAGYIFNHLTIFSASDSSRLIKTMALLVNY